jgi:Flp pilus assembly protein TadG
MMILRNLVERVRRQIESAENGAALVWVAGSMVALLAMTALAVDLGWYYLNAARLQRAADSAALAGVMYLPSSPASALADAESAARVNGFTSATVTPEVKSDNRYEITLSVDVGMFFASAIGIDSLTLSRTSTAEYVKPVPMGSPFNSFGNGYDAAQSFWAAIQGPYTSLAHGDPYQTLCRRATTSSPGSCTGSPSANATYRSTGYYYGVEIQPGHGYVDIEVFDATFDHRSSVSTETGDFENLTDTTRGGDFRTHYQLKMFDATPLDPSDNVDIAGCYWNVNDNDTYYTNNWRRLCRLNNPTAGTYILQVWTTGNSGGSNHYALRAASDGTLNTRVYGINDMSVFTNDAGGTGTANVYLAEVQPVHAGKRLELQFFDPGEGAGTAYMTVKLPDGTIPNCDWDAYDVDGNKTKSGSGQCKIKTTNSGTPVFNEQWVIATIDIPDTYTCATNCWWKMQLDLNVPHDRTTWQARVIGNPVRLVPNEN